ncbi:methyl-accepting chemotaxis protein [Vibrio sp. 10N.261.46.E11]|uniref:methyl-accepting chemotaxis protein n=1 Tax=Vibrio sp. 10N.261.46.E11 TaxID=3229662 RepID=UPI00354F2AB8
MLLSRYINIKVQFIVLLSIISLSLAAIISINVFIHNDNSQRLNQLESSYYPALEHATKIYSLLPNVKQQFEAAVVMEDEQALDFARQISSELQAEASRGADVLSSQATAFNQLSQQLAKYTDAAYALSEDFINLNDSFESLTSRANQLNIEYDSLVSLSETLRESASQKVVDTILHSEKAANDAANQSIWLGVFFLISVISVGYAIFKSVISSILLVTEKMKAIATGDGDLTVRIDYAGKDEISTLVESFNQFIEKLQGIIASTLSIGHELEVVSDKIRSESNQTLALNSTQRDHIEEVTEAVNNIIDLIEQVVNFASHADSQAQKANSSAQTGTQVVLKTSKEIEELATNIRDTACKLKELDQNASNVGSILNTIQSVAEQTNLLALNAAIEAARAGEHGRGFAVVSDEVRVLANNTQQSATEINALLVDLKSGSNAAVGAMDQGLASSSQAVGDAQNAGDYLLEISGQVEEITELNKQIASTTEHQARASKQIHTHMDDFRQCSHQVSQSTDQLEALSHQLSGIVTELSKSTSQFKV